MKKKLLAMVLTVGMMTAMLTACGGGKTASDEGASGGSGAVSDEEAPAEEGGSKGDITIGLAMPTNQEEIWVMHEKALRMAAEANGWEVISQCANGDTDKQISQVENMLTKGIDALILASVDPGTTGSVVSAAANEGVTVIGYDRVNSDDPYSLYLTFDNVEVGRQIAQAAVEAAPTGNYCLLGGDVVNQPATDEIHQGWMEVIQEHVDAGDITVVADQNCKNWASDEGLAHAENALTASHNEMAAVLCANDGIAGGAIQALESAGLAGSTFVGGQDSEVAAAQRIVAGSQSMTLYKDPSALAQAAIDAAEVFLTGGTPEANSDYEGVPTLSVAPQIVTPDNLDDVLIGSGYMSEKEVYNK